MIWISLALLSAFGQAFAWALKKKTLETSGTNNILGSLSFIIAGSAMFLLWLSLGKDWPDFRNEKFVLVMMIIILGNVIAVWAAYRALDKGSFSRLMPLMALTAILIVPIEYMLRGVVPVPFQIVGIILIVLGTVPFIRNSIVTEEQMHRSTYLYFSITLLIYSCMPVFQALAVDITKDGFFTAAIIHIGIGVCFLPLVYFSKETKNFRAILKGTDRVRILWFIVLSGLVIGFLENGPAMVALEYADASEVFALKRVMPFFALIFGWLWFQEMIYRKHIVGTVLLVLGSVAVIFFHV